MTQKAENATLVPPDPLAKRLFPRQRQRTMHGTQIEFIDLEIDFCAESTAEKTWNIVDA
jgi:hypothetical protein